MENCLENPIKMGSKEKAWEELLRKLGKEPKDLTTKEYYGVIPIQCKPSQPADFEKIIACLRTGYICISTKCNGHGITIELSVEYGDKKIKVRTASGEIVEEIAKFIPLSQFSDLAYKLSAMFHAEFVGMVMIDGEWHELGFSGVPSARSFRLWLQSHGKSSKDCKIKVMFYLFRLVEVGGRNMGQLENGMQLSFDIMKELLVPGFGVVDIVEHEICKVENSQVIYKGQTIRMSKLLNTLIENAKQARIEGYVVTNTENLSVTWKKDSFGMTRLINSVKAREYFELFAAVYKIRNNGDPLFVLACKDYSYNLTYCGILDKKRCNRDVLKAAHSLEFCGKTLDEMKAKIPEYKYYSNLCIFVAYAWISDGVPMSQKYCADYVPEADDVLITNIDEFCRNHEYLCAITERNKHAKKFMCEQGYNVGKANTRGKNSITFYPLEERKIASLTKTSSQTSTTEKDIDGIQISSEETSGLIGTSGSAIAEVNPIQRIKTKDLTFYFLPYGFSDGLYDEYKKILHKLKVKCSDNPNEGVDCIIAHEYCNTKEVTTVSKKCADHVKVITTRWITDCWEKKQLIQIGRYGPPSDQFNQIPLVPQQSNDSRSDYVQLPIVSERLPVAVPKIAQVIQAPQEQIQITERLPVAPKIAQVQAPPEQSQIIECPKRQKTEDFCSKVPESKPVKKTVLVIRGTMEPLNWCLTEMYSRDFEYIIAEEASEDVHLIVAGLDIRGETKCKEMVLDMLSKCSKDAIVVNYQYFMECKKYGKLLDVEPYRWCNID